jgi:hypothetical protein
VDYIEILPSHPCPALLPEFLSRFLVGGGGGEGEWGEGPVAHFLFFFFLTRGRRGVTLNAKIIILTISYVAIFISFPLLL